MVPRELGALGPAWPTRGDRDLLRGNADVPVTVTAVTLFGDGPLSSVFTDELIVLDCAFT